MIFKARTKFTFNQDRLVVAEGIKPFDDLVERERFDTLIDSVTVLVRFLDYISETGQICGSVLSLNSGFVYESEVFGRCRLRPVWQVETNTGTYYFDAYSGNNLQLTFM